METPKDSSCKMCFSSEFFSLVRNLVDQVGEFFSLRDQFFIKKIQNVGGKILINGNLKKY